MPRIVFGLLALMSLGWACATRTPPAIRPSDPLLSEAFRVALSVIERDRSPVVVAFLKTTDEQTRVAIRAVRKGISREEISETSEYSLPAGYFLLEEAVVRSGRARIAGVLGPIPKHSLLACGTGYYIDLRANGASWEVLHVGVREC
jgi:hypothetical protein